VSINSLNAQIRKTLNIFYLQLVDLFEERFYIHSLTVKFTAGGIGAQPIQENTRRLNHPTTPAP